MIKPTTTMKYLPLNKTSSEKLTQSDNALAIYNRSVNTAPESPWGFLHRAIFHNNQDQFDLALKDFNQAIHLNHNYGMSWSLNQSRPSRYWC